MLGATSYTGVPKIRGSGGPQNEGNSRGLYRGPLLMETTTFCLSAAVTDL